MASGQPKPEPGTGNAITKRAVAGSFLFRYPRDGREKVEVALFRRSGDVRTYQ